MPTSVTVTVPVWATVKGEKVVAPTPSVPENVSVVVGGALLVVVVVVVVVAVVLGDVVLCPQLIAKSKTTMNPATLMVTLRSAPTTRPRR
jgi:hypothetical protein